MTPILFVGLPLGLAGHVGRPALATAITHVRAASAVGVDAILLDDQLSHTTSRSETVGLEAGTLAAALAVAAEKIGLIPTVSVVRSMPYHVARLLATVDHLSAGWGGWLSVSGEHSPNGFESTVDEGTDSSEEFVRVLTGLWDSFSDDAFLRDRGSGIYFRPDALRALHHHGVHFDVAGPLNIARPPQGYPVHVRRLNSAADANRAGRMADVVIVPSELSDSATSIASEIRDAAESIGRDRTSVMVLLERPVDTLSDVPSARIGIDGFSLVTDNLASFEQALDIATALRRNVPLVPRPAATLRARLGLRRPVCLRPAASL